MTAQTRPLKKEKATFIGCASRRERENSATLGALRWALGRSFEWPNEILTQHAWFSYHAGVYLMVRPSGFLRIKPLADLLNEDARTRDSNQMAAPHIRGHIERRKSPTSHNLFATNPARPTIMIKFRRQVSQKLGNQVSALMQFHLVCRPRTTVQNPTRSIGQSREF